MAYINFSNLNEVILLDKRMVLPEIILKIIAYSFGKVYYGVFLFFILSGYLIHSYKSSNKNISWIFFLKNRFLRIYPLYFLLLFYFLYYSWFEWGYMTDFVLHTFLILNFNVESFYSITDFFGCLVIEVQFYLLYPFIYFIIKKNSAIGFFFVTLFFWMTSCVFFEYRNKIKLIYSRYTKIVYLKFFFFAFICFTEAGDYFGLFNKIPLINVFLFCSLFLLILNHKNLNFSTLNFNNVKSILILFGAISYSLYLVHNPVLISLKKYFFNVFDNPYLNIFHEIFCVVIVLILISFSLYQLVEKRFIKYVKQIKITQL